MIDEDCQPDAQAPPTPNNRGASSSPATPPQVDAWLERHGNLLWRFVLGRVRSRSVAEDVVQETLLAAWRAAPSFSGASSERTWLLGIAAHKIADHFRAERRGRVDPRGGDPRPTDGGTPRDAPMFDERGKWATPPRDWGLGAPSKTENAEILEALRRCIDSLPPSQAEVVVLRDLLGVPAGEVCKAMGISPTNLWSRAHRARAALRACVERALGIGAGGST